MRAPKKCLAKVRCSARKPLHARCQAKEAEEREGEEASALEMVPPPRIVESEPRFAPEEYRV